MSRPPFPITAKSNQLRLVKSETSTSGAVTQQAADDNTPLLIRGLAYPASTPGSLPVAGAIGGFRLSPRRATIEPGDAASKRFLWDGDAVPEGTLARNEFQLQTSTLEGPDILAAADSHWLSVLAMFKVRYHASGYAARLGEIRLVESRRFLTLDNGDTHTLLDTHALDEPVLYLEDNDDTTVVRQQSPWQAKGDSRDHCFDYRASQVLHREIEGQPVNSVTVLEQYTSYFMERPLTAALEDSIWVPAYAPVSWGWSMRVEPDASGWNITRRKLMLPTVGHEGWQLPEWHSNTRECACST